MPATILTKEAATRGVPQKKMFIKISQSSQENTFVRLSFKKSCRCEACNFTKTETLAQVFSCEFYENFKNTVFTEHHRTTVSVTNMITLLILIPDFSQIGFLSEDAHHRTCRCSGLRTRRLQFC